MPLHKYAEGLLRRVPRKQLLVRQIGQSMKICAPPPKSDKVFLGAPFDKNLDFPNRAFTDNLLGRLRLNDRFPWRKVILKAGTI